MSAKDSLSPPHAQPAHIAPSPPPLPTHTHAQVVYFDGNYAEYEEYKVNVLGQDVDDSFQHNKFKM